MTRADKKGVTDSDGKLTNEIRGRVEPRDERLFLLCMDFKGKPVPSLRKALHGSPVLILCFYSDSFFEADTAVCLVAFSKQLKVAFEWL